MHTAPCPQSIARAAAAALGYCAADFEARRFDLADEAGDLGFEPVVRVSRRSTGAQLLYRAADWYVHWVHDVMAGRFGGVGPGAAKT